METSHPNYIAHVRKHDGKQQSLQEHLRSVSNLTSIFTSKFELTQTGKILGLLHDLGKYSDSFQNYLRSATGLLNPDADEYVDSKYFKGRIDHSTAGAQWLWNETKKFGNTGKFAGHILAMCLASHHSGLINSLKSDGENDFIRRINKDIKFTHLEECKNNARGEILNEIGHDEISILIKEILVFLEKIDKAKYKGKNISLKIKYFYFGMFTRLLFGCLIDADRIDSADFEVEANKSIRNFNKPNWDIAIKRFENKIKKLKVNGPVDAIRQKISNTCKLKANNPTGAFSLTVPTGGGKTLSSLRFALHHAQKHKLDRIIYVIPYTSIIEQNANAIRKILDKENNKSWVLEIHSNLEHEQQTWRHKLIAENWDSPVVLITMVQFLDVLFGPGTRGSRKIHQLVNSVVIFDEIQTLPIKCVHLFSNAINFFTNFTNTTVLLCTATQPLLNKLKNSENGELFLPQENEIIENVNQLFENLKRVNIINKTKSSGWNKDEITNLIVNEVKTKNNCLVIVNTKKWAEKLYLSCTKNKRGFEVYHLSTNLCPEHRKHIFRELFNKLKKGEPVLCISTQLVEAGVDIDFSSVIRFVAGLDSIAQAAGRCNRNGNKGTSDVQVINPNEENIDLLVDIKEGRDVTLRIFSEYPEADFTSPDIMQKYFQYYFYKRSNVMSYPISRKQYTRDETILNILSDNVLNPGKKTTPPYLLPHSFMDAGKLFNAIEAPTKSLLVPYSKGEEIIAELCSQSVLYDTMRYHQLLINAQRYSINVFPNTWKLLLEEKAIHETQPDQGIYYLEKEFYHNEFGLSLIDKKPMGFLGF